MRAVGQDGATKAYEVLPLACNMENGALKQAGTYMINNSARWNQKQTVGETRSSSFLIDYNQPFLYGCIEVPGACTYDDFIALASSKAITTPEQWCQACENTKMRACATSATAIKKHSNLRA